MRWGFLAILVLGSAAPAAAEDAGAGMACVDAGTGAVRWRTATAAGRMSLRVDGDTVWARRAGEAWRRHDLVTGHVLAAGAPEDAPAPVDDLWTTTDAILETRDGTARTVVSTGAFVDDLAVVGDVLAFALDKDDGVVHGWDHAAGALAWTLRPRDLLAAPEIGDGTRVEALGDRLLLYAPPALIAVAPATGEVAWIAEVPALEGHWGSLRAAALGDRWIAAIDGVVVAMDAATGAIAWTVDAGAGAATSLVAAGETACFDRRAAEALPYARDEAEIARTLEVTVAGGAVTALRWVSRADARGSRRSAIELPVVEAGVALTLTAGDLVVRRDLSSLRAASGVTYVDVPGAWEDARVGRIVATAP